ncbi:putative S-adenosylmethionine-dependent methyltransferase [Phycisphaerae bacterium RAS1]|nr:putative S-adenosylmethionine-dependent methyltransferase [Phycisphaerae bacterium RAS1]
MSSSADQFNWKEVRKFWETHSALFAQIDDGADPDALANVCHPGAPAWLNDYYARFQRQVYSALFHRVPPPTGDSRALEVGCGAGRWCRFLAAAGFKTTGVDLQPHLVERNRKRYPHIEFVCSAIQDFQPTDRFDVISHVTVIQHIPKDQQLIAIRRFREILKPGGHVLALENVHDRGTHVFANRVAEWTRMFETSGFRRIAVRRYDYSPFHRSLMTVRELGSFLWRRRASATPETYLHTFDDPNKSRKASVLRRTARAVDLTFQRVAVACDTAAEATLIPLNPPFSCVHCGFLFRAV